MGKTKNKILEAMYDIIVEKGYDKTSIAQICDKLMITKPSIYYYFKGKEQIFCELLAWEYETFTAPNENCLDIYDKDKFIEYLSNYGISYFGAYQETPKYRKLIAEAEIQARRIPAIKDLVTKYDTDFVNALAEICKHGVNIGSFPPDTNITDMVCMIKFFTDGVEQAIANDEECDYRKIWKNFVFMLTK